MVWMLNRSSVGSKSHRYIALQYTVIKRHCLLFILHLLLIQYPTSIMPKRGRGRGGSRGGLKGGRGGYLGGKNKKARGGSWRGRGSRGGRGGSVNQGYPELNDLDNPDFISVSHPEKTMKAAAARRSKLRSHSRLQDEALQTQENMENTMKLPLRKRPVEFVKALTFDPSKELIRKLQEKEAYLKMVDDSKSEVEPTIEVEIEQEHAGSVCREEQDDDMRMEDCVSKKSLETDEIIESGEEVMEVVVEQEKPKSRPKPKNKLTAIPDDQLFFVDNDGFEATDINTIEVEDVPPPRSFTAGNNTEFNPSLTIGHIQLTISEDQDGNHQTTLPKLTKPLKNLKTFSAGQAIRGLSDVEEDSYTNTDTGSEALYQSYNSYISRIIQNMRNQEDEDDFEEDDDDYSEESDDNIHDELYDDVEEEAKFIANLDDEYDNEEDVHDPTGNLRNLKLEEEDGDSDPEYGFLPEDYESFDISLVDVINIRFGSTSNQYHMKSFRLTGTYEFEWIDQDLFSEFLLENGMPEHRLNAYFKYIKTQLTPVEVEERDYDNLAFSDSDTDYEEEYDERQEPLSDDSENEGLDDLIKFSTRYEGLRNQDFETHSLTTKGKGKKKELNLDHVSDLDLKHALQEQYQSKRELKRQRKQDRENNIKKEHANSNDLSLKYSTSLHVKDIKNEFESFFIDSKRNALTFPPMDPHAIKTISKFAYYYNMKSRKFGQGLKAHAVVIKNKRTFRSLPDYHSVQQLMKQRRIFQRIDLKRSKTEIEQEESKSSRRGKPSKAHVKEGDIVGANAPEISSDNIGRRLLMKMGWSAGQGLGAENKGIPEPVLAKVKKTKLGIRVD